MILSKFCSRSEAPTAVFRRTPTVPFSSERESVCVCCLLVLEFSNLYTAVDTPAEAA
jgi:hypothetical protein